MRLVYRLGIMLLAIGALLFASALSLGVFYASKGVFAYASTCGWLFLVGFVIFAVAIDLMIIFPRLDSSTQTKIYRWVQVMQRKR